jgi:four helix bundle protein
MGVKRVEDLRAYQQARLFKLEVYRLIDDSPAAQKDWKFRSQLAEAAASNESNVREGFRRFTAAEMARFLVYALASLSEALGRVQDGIDRQYFRAEDCSNAFALGDTSDRTTTALFSSLQRFIRKRPGSGRGGRG